MRYTILLLCFFFAACTEGEYKKTKSTGVDISSMDRFEVTEGGMKYVMYKGILNNSSNGGSYGTGAMYIINLTKDSLECEYYKKQLNQK